MSIAFCLLCRRPSKSWLSFLDNLQSTTQYKVIVICDDNTYDSEEYNTSVRIIKYETDTVKSAYYTHACFASMGSFIIAWDKAIYHFCEVEKEYDYVYFVEDDVFIPSIESIQNIQEKYTDDLLCHCDNGFFEKDKGDINVWNWRHANGALNLPWYASMVCAIRVSNALLRSVQRHVQLLRRIPFIEILWNTLAHQNKLSVRIIQEFEYIIYNPSSLDYKNYIEILKKGQWLHPMKEMEEHDEIRKIIVNWL